MAQKTPLDTPYDDRPHYIRRQRMRHPSWWFSRATLFALAFTPLRLFGDMLAQLGWYNPFFAWLLYLPPLIFALTAAAKFPRLALQLWWVPWQRWNPPGKAEGDV